MRTNIFEERITQAKLSIEEMVKGFYEIISAGNHSRGCVMSAGLSPV